jgi:hypothetical protein
MTFIILVTQFWVTIATNAYHIGPAICGMNCLLRLKY